MNVASYSRSSGDCYFYIKPFRRSVFCFLSKPIRIEILIWITPWWGHYDKFIIRMILHWGLFGVIYSIKPNPNLTRLFTWWHGSNISIKCWLKEVLLAVCLGRGHSKEDNLAWLTTVWLYFVNSVAKFGISLICWIFHIHQILLTWVSNNNKFKILNHVAAF